MRELHMRELQHLLVCTGMVMIACSIVYINGPMWRHGNGCARRLQQAHCGSMMSKRHFARAFIGAISLPITFIVIAVDGKLASNGNARTWRT
jgi:hypothetical protein